MTVTAPGDSPPTGDQGGFLSWLQGLAPEAQSAIMRVMAQANPVSPAAADTLNKGSSPLANPSPVDPRLAGGGPPVPSAVLGGGQPPAPTNPLTQPSPVDPRLVGGGPPVDAATLQRIQASITPRGGSSGGAGASGTVPIGSDDNASTNPTPWFPSSNTPYAPNPAVGAPMPPVAPAAIARARHPAAARINPRATALAPAPAAAAGSPFTQIAAQNQDWSGGALARSGERKISALDLSKLFGRS